jgi:hypothetical protein
LTLDTVLKVFNSKYKKKDLIKIIRNVLIAAFAAMFFSFCNNSKAPKAENYLITETQVGVFELGKPVQQSHKGLDIESKTRLIKSEGEEIEEIFYQILSESEELLTIAIEDAQTKIATEIFVHSDKFKTAENIGIGTTIEDFSKIYPDYKIWYTYVSDRFVIETDQTKIQFLLNKDDFVGDLEVNSDMIYLDFADFKEDSKIEKIRIY